MSIVFPFPGRHERYEPSRIEREKQDALRLIQDVEDRVKSLEARVEALERAGQEGQTADDG